MHWKSFLAALVAAAASSKAAPQIPGEVLTGTVGNTTIAGEGTSPTGPDANGKYEISGINIRANFIPYGASISNLFINDTSGCERDIVAGFDNATYYSIDRQHPHFGGVPGRYANRIKNSSFVLDGTTYNVLPNENPEPGHPQGIDQLHGGPDGWDWRNWTVVAHTTNSITFSLTDPDGDQGFPGEVVSYVTYTLGNMTWDLQMMAIATTKKTPLMLSSHVRSLPLPSVKRTASTIATPGGSGERLPKGVLSLAMNDAPLALREPLPWRPSSRKIKSRLIGQN
jgi:aldose 1-epimerase